MRLMLNRWDEPSLLVTVADNYDPLNFEFSVINGGWEGRFVNGDIYVDKYKNEIAGQAVISCTDQNRLYGKDNWDYETVFDEFDNPNYVTKRVVITFDDMDDDISF